MTPFGPPISVGALLTIFYPPGDKNVNPLATQTTVTNWCQVTGIFEIRTMNMIVYTCRICEIGVTGRCIQMHSPGLGVLTNTISAITDRCTG